MNEIHRERLKAEKTVKEFSKAGLIYCSYCRDSGELFDEKCIFDPRGTRIDHAYFTFDNCPTEFCTRHVLCKYDSVTKGMANDQCPRENLVNVSLVRVDDRSFPKDIYVTDSEYVYRDASVDGLRESDPARPYFYADLPEGEYVGKSKREKQFNSGCTEH